MVRFLPFLSLVFFLAGCSQSNATWEDFKTAGRYMQKGVDAMWGKEYESRMLTSDDEFIGPYDSEFIPLKDSDLQKSLALGDRPLPQPKGMPGEKGIPALSAFLPPPDTLRSIFLPVHFHTDEHVVKDQREVEGLMELAQYLKKHKSTYLSVEGNCDKRASSAYNMALGLRRANYVRSFLVKQGVDPNQVYTVSFGKENPIAFGDTPEDFRLNRRCEFKIYEK